MILHVLVAHTPYVATAAAPPETPAAPVEDPSRLYAQGVELAEKGAYLEAVAAFERAYALRPHARVLYNLGQAFIRLGRYADAHRHLSRYLADEATSSSPERRAAIEAQLEELRNATAVVQVKVEPEGANIFVDNEPLGKSPLLAPVRVDPGRHHILAHRDGYGSSSAFITVGAGDAERVNLVLVATAPPQPEPVPANAMSSGPREGDGTADALKVQHEDARKARAYQPSKRAVSAAATTLWIAGGALAVTAGGLTLWNMQRREDWERTERSIAQQDPDGAAVRHLEDENNQLARSINRVDDWSLALAVASGITLIGAGMLQIYKLSIVPGPEPRVALNLRW